MGKTEPSATVRKIEEMQNIELRNKWRMRVFSATWLSYFGFYFARKPFYAVKADLETTLGWDPEKLAWIGTIYLITYTLGQFISGALGDKFGSKLMLTIGMLGAVIANAMMGFSNSFLSFCVLMALNGLFQSTGWSNNVGIMGRWLESDERGRVMGFWATNFQIGGAMALPIAAYLGHRYGVQWSFFGGSLVLLAVWVYFILHAKDSPTDVGLEENAREKGIEANSELPDEKWNRRAISNILTIGGFYFFLKFIRYALWSWAPYMLSKYYQMQSDEAGYISTIFDISGAAGVIACGWLGDRYGKRNVVSLSFLVLMIVACLALFLFGSSSIAFFALCMGIIGFSLYGPDAIMTSAGAIDAGSAKRAAFAAGIINGIGSLGAIAQELILGYVLRSDNGGENEASLTLIFGILLASSVLSAVFLAILVARNPTNNNKSVQKN